MHALKALVIFMGVLIVIGMGAVAYGIATKMGKVGGGNNEPAISDTAGQSWQDDLRVKIPPGARVAETTMADGWMVIRLTLADGGETFLVFDLATGTRLGSIDLVTEGGTQ